MNPSKKDPEKKNQKNNISAKTTIFLFSAQFHGTIVNIVTKTVYNPQSGIIIARHKFSSLLNSEFTITPATLKKDLMDQLDIGSQIITVKSRVTSHFD